MAWGSVLDISGLTELLKEKQDIYYQIGSEVYEFLEEYECPFPEELEVYKEKILETYEIYNSIDERRNEIFATTQPKKKWGGKVAKVAGASATMLIPGFGLAAGSLMASALFSEVDTYYEVPADIADEPFQKAAEDYRNALMSMGMEIYDLSLNGTFELLDIMDSIEGFSGLKENIDHIRVLEKQISRLHAQQDAKQGISQLSSPELPEPVKKNRCECGRAVDKDCKFCPSCGNPLVVLKKTCKCGANLIDGAKFCANCGAGVDVRPQGESVQLRAADVREKAQAAGKCVCGARMQPGEPLCMECGRKLM